MDLSDRCLERERPDSGPDLAIQFARSRLPSVLELAISSAEVRRHRCPAASVSPHSHSWTSTFLACCISIHDSITLKASQFYHSNPNQLISTHTANMSRRFATIAGVTAVGGGAYYLYSAGGDPKLAEKQFERKQFLFMASFHTGTNMSRRRRPRIGQVPQRDPWPHKPGREGWLRGSRARKVRSEGTCKSTSPPPQNTSSITICTLLPTTTLSLVVASVSCKEGLLIESPEQ